MKIVLNGRVEYCNSDSLRDFLMERGFSFPCSARGICGKCIVNAPMLTITDRDKRMLTEEQIAQGLRLACDKTIFDGLEVDAEIKPIPHITECDAYAIIYKDKIEVAMVAEDFVEKRIAGGSNGRVGILSTIAHELLEMLEKYSVAKATTLYVLGEKELISLISSDVEEGGSYVGADLMLPTEEVYVVPCRECESSVDYVVEKCRTDIDEAVKKVVVDCRFRLKL